MEIAERIYKALISVYLGVVGGIGVITYGVISYSTVTEAAAFPRNSSLWQIATAVTILFGFAIIVGGAYYAALFISDLIRIIRGRKAE